MLAVAKELPSNMGLRRPDKERSNMYRKPLMEGLSPPHPVCLPRTTGKMILHREEVLVLHTSSESCMQETSKVGVGLLPRDYLSGFPVEEAFDLFSSPAFALNIAFKHVSCKNVSLPCSP